MLPTVHFDTNEFAARTSQTAAMPAETLATPPRIDASNRSDFRKAALAFIERAAASGSQHARIDLNETEELDASGLGVLVLLQKRANELHVKLELVRVPKDIRHLLALTKLEHLFRFA
jgi:anti-anti-sigma factor